MLPEVSADDFLPAFTGAPFLGAVRGAAAFAVETLLIKISFAASPLL
jgi:hypothetical protein